MDKIVKNILKKIESEGYEAYIVGGFVRDKLLNKVSYDVDICTNALPMNLKNIFKITQTGNGYGGFNLKIKKYNIDITTYRMETRYDNRKPVEVKYVTNLFEDIKRRDFTINSLCMDKNDNIIDLLNGSEDLKKRIIKIIGDADTKFNEDPLRILRAIRFATVLNFDIEEETYKSILKNSSSVKTLSSERIKEELSKILSSSNYQKGLNYLNDTKITEHLDLKFDKVVYSTDLLGMWAQLETPKIIFSKTEQNNITKIKQIIKKGTISNFELFNYGLYICTVAGEIIGKKKQDINRIYRLLPIKSMKDIDISGTEIMDLLKIEPCKQISDIISSIKVAILNGELTNRKSDIKKYIMGKWYHE